jgi:hypothetical protein
MSTNVNESEFPLYTGLVTPQWETKIQKYFKILIKQFYQFLTCPNLAKNESKETKFKKNVYNVERQWTMFCGIVWWIFYFSEPKN